MKSSVLILVLLTYLVAATTGFSRQGKPAIVIRQQKTTRRSSTALFEKISDKRRKQLGIGEDEDEYDLSVALDQNTSPLITKIIAGSLIIAIIGLLVAGIIIPATTDYGEGVCNPLLTGGRC